ncbi:cytochrome P450 family 26 subfamily A [Fistulifera solaris]|uniref:Cytochrome P450 family 26 subfamily A n=1 Tax=Fistulifera solaris TaxID=1519565 RepID=A0A1Z5KM53_FISSO|nr:cytochrome P450 family 26 subfamily A [Fistulifera solaris]|eukprot:GAX27404.1 cytochrome P450 family 26 subfamily A [Fistulifera solaris]
MASLFLLALLPHSNTLELRPQRSMRQTLRNRIYRPVKQILWPNTLSDLSREEQLPPGPLGCPIRGLNPRLSSPSFGPGLLFYQVSQKVKHARVFKIFSQRKGIAVVSGYQNTKTVLSQEFSAVVPQSVPFTAKIVGSHSLRCADNKQRHSELRKLVGAAVQPNRVRDMVPALQHIAESVLEQQSSTTMQMEDVCTSFALDVAWRLIIGLQDMDQISIFRYHVKAWLRGIYSGANDDWQTSRQFLVNQIEKKLQYLEQNGPDESTVSGMLFATEENERKATKEEIIDNVLLLILAGTETSAATLTNCMLLAGLRPDAWQKVVQEQQEMIEKYGPQLSYEALENDCRYTDGVVRESLRIKPTTGGSMRGTASTIVVDGYQIPAGWGITYDRYLTHLLDPISREKDELHMDVRHGFRPERWLDEATRPGQEFLPFGVGPRYCLGAELAMCEMKVFLSVLARQMPSFELIYPSIDESIRWRQKAIIPIPEKGVLIRRTSLSSELTAQEQVPVASL